MSFHETEVLYSQVTRQLGDKCNFTDILIECFRLQVMLKESVYLAVSIYGTVCLIAAGASLALPIETKGREMKVGGDTLCFVKLS